MKNWNPDKYLEHAELHSQPIENLVSHIKNKSPRTIVDLGCGPGNSTEFAAARWPRAKMTGVDVSKEMLEKARTRHPDWTWVLAGLQDFRPARPFDLVISCAALQWLPDHDQLLPRLWKWVRPRGALAVQMPANQDSPLHRALFKTAKSKTWKPFTGRARAVLNFQPPKEYFRILSPLAKRLEIWETVYHHEMASLDALLDWGQATFIRPFLDQIPGAVRQRKFLSDVKRACAKDYPPTWRRTIIYVQKRQFFVAYKGAKSVL